LSCAIDPDFGVALFFILGAADSLEVEGAADSFVIDEPAAGLELSFLGDAASPLGDAAFEVDGASFDPPWLVPCAVANPVVASSATAATETIKLLFIAISSMTVRITASATMSKRNVRGAGKFLFGSAMVFKSAKFRTQLLST
jgi:hypothetical protein